MDRRIHEDDGIQVMPAPSRHARLDRASMASGWF